MKGKVGGQWNKIFMEIFRSMLDGFCPFSPVFLTDRELCSFWYGFERSFHSAQVSGQSCPRPLKLMTSQVEERMWIRTGSSGANGLISLRNTCTFPNQSTPTSSLPEQKNHSWAKLEHKELIVQSICL